MKTLGVISDTHGLLRPEALEALAGVDAIVHAGDIGAPEIIDRLQQIAPVHAVRGNVDRAFWADEYSPTEIVELDGQSLYVLHDLQTLDLDPAAAGFRAVISGHSHNPAVSEQRGVVYLNPGSAGPRRLRLPISLARLTIGQDEGEDRGPGIVPIFVSAKMGLSPLPPMRLFEFGEGQTRVAVELITLET
jgi:uncharacterized protein